MEEPVPANTEPQIRVLRAILAEKLWVGFDLDDTLHEFRRSSGKATNRVFKRIHEQFGVPLPALEEQYSLILKAKTATAFSDGKTSSYYRRERFASLLARFYLPQDKQFIEELLDLYEDTLTASLELKCGALSLLFAVKNEGKKIIIITEGPQDAQEKTIEALGISGYIDFLATTNHFLVTKTSGLFSKVLNHLDISPADVVYIGDSKERDMKPAMAGGIFSIHLDEANHESLDISPDSPPRINTLGRLQHIFSSND
jgi:putative hydrolase of the HAD superfamily